MKLKCPECGATSISIERKSTINQTSKNSKNYYVIKCRTCGYEEGGLTLSAAVSLFLKGKKIKEADKTNLLSGLSGLVGSGLDQNGLADAMFNINTGEKGRFIWEKN